LEYAKGLLGYSDGDVLLHAICDALLGASGLGDIGGHFPDTDPAYKGISSVELLRHVVKLLSESGFDVVNIDANVITEAPRIGRYINDMKEVIGDAAGIPAERINVKGRTNESLGSIGRGEAIAAQAVTIVKQKA
jgi:2-C-methyl-D-erythritol 2,4-cyclodiphosphate synthase